MIVKVHMQAHCEPGSIRMVCVPNDKDRSRGELLEAVFHYGQNDFQPDTSSPSVSVGDVIELAGEGQSAFYRVDPVGFTRVVPQAFFKPETFTHV